MILVLITKRKNHKEVRYMNEKKFHLRLVDNFGNSKHENKDYLKSQKDTKATTKTSICEVLAYYHLRYTVNVMSYPK